MFKIRSGSDADIPTGRPRRSGKYSRRIGVPGVINTEVHLSPTALTERFEDFVMT